MLADSSIDSSIVWTATAHPNSAVAQYARFINNGYAAYPDRNVSPIALRLSNNLTSTSGSQYTRYWIYENGMLYANSTYSSSSSNPYSMVYSDGFTIQQGQVSGIYLFEK